MEGKGNPSNISGSSALSYTKFFITSKITNSLIDLPVAKFWIGESNCGMWASSKATL